MIQKYRYLAAIVICLGFYAKASAFVMPIIKAPGLEHVTLHHVVDAFGAFQFEVNFDDSDGDFTNLFYIRHDRIDPRLLNKTDEQLQIFFYTWVLYLDRLPNGDFRLQVRR